MLDGRRLGSLGTATVLLAGSIAVVAKLEKDLASDLPLPDAITLVSFYTSLALLYALAAWLWKSFYTTDARRRSMSSAALDTGLVAIGKYFPGKIWGILARGAFNESSVKITTRNVALSAMEQLYVLVAGLMVLVIFLAASRDAIPNALLPAIVILSGVSARAILVFARNVAMSIRPSLDLPRLRGGKDAMLIAGYAALWLITAVPILLLVASGNELSAHQLTQIGTAFVGAIIAGWLAFFAPGGVGIRETVFVLLAPEWLTWQESLYWISVHRSLTILFDICYGVACILIAAKGMSTRRRQLQ